jgi:mRNA-degrading endonuclease toxin of MazEF toxin-antitoxin module
MTGNEQDDERMEFYLRQFRPQQPRPLPGRTKVAFFRWRMPLTACAGIVFILSLSTWLLLPKPDNTSHQSVISMQQTMPIAQEISLVRLGHAAQKDSADLDAQLDSLSALLLPDVRRSHGILNSLAHE